jgi:hypothetical protein
MKDAHHAAAARGRTNPHNKSPLRRAGGASALPRTYVARIATRWNKREKGDARLYQVKRHALLGHDFCELLRAAGDVRAGGEAHGYVVPDEAGRGARVADNVSPRGAAHPITVVSTYPPSFKVGYLEAKEKTHPVMAR